jgi:hypothetical protein
MAALAFLPDEVVDAISVEPDTVPHKLIRGVGRITGPEAALPVITTLESLGWADLMYAAEGVQDRQGIDTNDVGFWYPNDALDWGDDPFDGVEVHNPLWEILVTMPAFERLMARFFRALIVGAERSSDSVTGEPWWPRFTDIIEMIERRVSADRTSERTGG